jgi:small subunit ribosomal protein S19
MLLGARQRRTLARGFTVQEKALVEKLVKKDNVKTHARSMVILPKMVGKTIMIYNGKEFVKVRIAEEMIGHVLGEFAPTRRKVAHNAPGIGATKSSASVSVR